MGAGYENHMTPELKVYFRWKKVMFGFICFLYSGQTKVVFQLDQNGGLIFVVLRACPVKFPVSSSVRFKVNVETIWKALFSLLKALLEIPNITVTRCGRWTPAWPCYAASKHSLFIKELIKFLFTYQFLSIFLFCVSYKSTLRLQHGPPRDQSCIMSTPEL